MTLGLQMLSFAAAFIARPCPEFGEVQRWPEEMAEEQSGDVDAVMDIWRETFRYLLTLGERAGRSVVDDWTASRPSVHEHSPRDASPPVRAHRSGRFHKRNRGEGRRGSVRRASERQQPARCSRQTDDKHAPGQSALRRGPILPGCN